MIELQEVYADAAPFWVSWRAIQYVGVYSPGESSFVRLEGVKDGLTVRTSAERLVEMREAARKADLAQ